MSNENVRELEESATQLDEGAARLDEGAAKLNEGAAKLHEVAARLHERAGAHAAAARGVAAGAQVHMNRALRLAKDHPLGTLAALAAGMALLEVELAVGVLVGLGATALLTAQNGPAVRRRVALRGRRALRRLRTVAARQRLPWSLGVPARSAAATMTGAGSAATP